jgi:hypothetical protein
MDRSPVRLYDITCLGDHDRAVRGGDRSGSAVRKYQSQRSDVRKMIRLPEFRQLIRGRNVDGR